MVSPGVFQGHLEPSPTFGFASIACPTEVRGAVILDENVSHTILVDKCCFDGGNQNVMSRSNDRHGVSWLDNRRCIIESHNSRAICCSIKARCEGGAKDESKGRNRELIKKYYSL
jgi:hypothetical protein